MRRHVDYRDDKVFKTLRYGHCMIMADQDNDGSHIKGLVINFLHWYNDTLLKRPGCVRSGQTHNIMFSAFFFCCCCCCCNYD